MLTLKTAKTPTETVPTAPADHDWVEYARTKGPSAFPARKPHLVCKRCGVVCRPDTEYAPCDTGTVKKDRPC
jgi:hypothetical protein